MRTTFEIPTLRYLSFGLLLATEIIAVTSGYEAPDLSYSLNENTGSFTVWLFDFSKECWRIALWIIGGSFLTMAPHYKRIVNEFAAQTFEHKWSVWLLLHILVFFAFAITTYIIFKKPVDPNYLTASWFLVWFILVCATFILWLLAFAPTDFWLQLIRKMRIELLTGTFLGVSVWMLVGMFYRKEAPLAQTELWDLLAGFTLQIVYYLIGLFYSDLIYEPESFVVGTVSYPVEIASTCSGIEGISLIAAFLTVYLWLFQKNLRFPQVLWLYPIAMIAIWLANAVRIALLIAVGSSISAEIAGRGFHAQAGWIAFILISISAIALTHRMQFFSSTKEHKEQVITDDIDNNHLSAALLTPFLVQMATLMLTSAFSSDFDWLYPARIMVITAVLYCYRKTYSKFFSKLDWQAPGIGIAVFIVWLLLEPSNVESGEVLSRNIHKLSTEWAIFWLIFRVVGSSIIIPITEELVFRGYLIRKLIARDFDTISSSHFTWLSFVISSLLFGLLHDRWLAGTLAGMGYAIAVYRRGQLSDSIIAHMTTNALIAIFVLSQGRWALWA